MDATPHMGQIYQFVLDYDYLSLVKTYYKYNRKFIYVSNSLKKYQKHRYRSKIFFQSENNCLNYSQTSVLIYLMNLFLQQNQLHVSAILQSIFLSQFRFRKRFIKSSRVEDPYVRFYEISHDTEDNNKRMVQKDYSASTNKQKEDVLMNLQNYKSLQQISGISKLVAFCHIQQTDNILAAFQYNDSTLNELIDMHFFQDNRNQFYLFMLKQLVYVYQTTKACGLELEDLIPENILLYKTENYFRIKILFDEREKKYDKILEGIKVYCSVQSIEIALKFKDYEQKQQGGEFIFQLGLLLLDFIYIYELSCIKRPSLKQITKPFDLSYKGYHIFHDNSRVTLNSHLIAQKKNFLKSLNDEFIQSIVQLIDKMIAPEKERISLQELIFSQKWIQNTQQPQAIEIDYETPNMLISPIKQKKSPNDSLKYSEQREVPQVQPNHKNVGTQTTITRNVFIDSAPQIDSKNSNFSQISINYNIIPKNKILGQINAHSCVKDQLYKFMNILETKNTVVKKEYLDNHVYYGEIDGSNHKRYGLGMYLYSQGDLYFGNWKDNVLVDGIYIFKNSDCYEGVVKNGKQGWGRYYYANGNVYQGDWKDDLKYGRGKMSYSNGEVYDGMWVKGKRNGEGTYYYQTGAVFKGNFVQGKKEGFGFIAFPNQTRVQAYWVSNHIEGKGKIFYANGHYYEGEFYLSQKQGLGTYKWQDQTKYEGQFKNNLMLGEAKVKFFENEFYEGHIQNGKRQGCGIYRYTNGDEFKGQWKNDQKLRGQYKFHDGRSFDGRFKKNQMNYGVMIYENGDSYEGQFLNGERHGIGSYRNSVGEIMFDGKWARDRFVQNL